MLGFSYGLGDLLHLDRGGVNYMKCCTRNPEGLCGSVLERKKHWTLGTHALYDLGGKGLFVGG